MKSFPSYAVAATLAAVACAAPQIIPMPIMTIRPIGDNATISSLPPKPTAVICEAECEVRYPELQAVSWVREDQINYYTTIVVTVSVIIQVRGNITSEPQTTTIANDVDPIYDLWRGVSTNDAGTAYIDLPMSSLKGKSSTQLAYPTPFFDYPSEYHWSGILSTSSACETPSELTFGVLTDHPQYPQPKTATPNEDDLVGAKYTAIRVPSWERPDKYWFDAAFPSVPAFASCKEVSGKIPGDDFYAPKFVYETTTTTITRGTEGIHVQPSTDGFETTSKTRNTWAGTPMPPRPTFEDTSKAFGTSEPSSSATVTDDRTKETPQNPPQNPPQDPPQTPQGPPQNPPDHASIQHPPEITSPPPPIITAPPTGSILVPTMIDGRPTATHVFVPPDSFETASIGQTITVGGTRTVVAPPSASFVVVPTTINGVATSVPAYIIAGTSTASIGQTVTLNGQRTVLSAPPALFTMLPTTINGQATSVPGYIISGAAAATLGQTVDINGASTVLSSPAPYLTMIRTTINGIVTSVPAYIVSGTSTAFPGQTITYNGQTTVLPNADLKLIYIPTTINGVATSVPAYVVSGGSTAFPGQTVTINGQSVVLPNPDVVLSSITTSILGRITVIPVYIISGSITAAVGQTITLAGQTTVLPRLTSTPTDTTSEGPISTALGGARETGKKDAAVDNRVSLGVLLSAISCVIVCVV
ncbi:unnamed protein product [Periconia digitata]|uniref:Uncharacterized protein n=1 Tax=Periconia digitata TaxID=1303443 RepID=A0A9W4XRZ5_9PLEO|nr:unnamed protein product [Periconia digitata]